MGVVCTLPVSKCVFVYDQPKLISVVSIARGKGFALQCVALCCIVLQCVAVCCSVLQCVAVCCSVCTQRINEFV